MSDFWVAIGQQLLAMAALVLAGIGFVTAREFFRAETTGWRAFRLCPTFGFSLSLAASLLRALIEWQNA